MKCVTTIAIIFSTAVACFPQSTVTFATGQSARLVIGQPEFDAESDTASQTIVGAVGGLAFANDTLFVADSNLVGAAPVNNRVLIFNSMSKQLPVPNEALAYSTLCPVCVGTANLVLGQPDFVSSLPAPCIIPPSTVTQTITPTTPTCLTTSPQTPIATGMNTPAGVATDGVHLAVADTFNNRVLIWNTIPVSMNQPPDVVVGQPNFTSRAFPGDTPTASSLRGPQGVWLQNGQLFIADTQNQRVLIYNSIPTANGAAADIVLGQPNMTTWVQVNIADQDTSAAANNMLTPVSVTSDGKHLFVSDVSYSRVLIWNSIPTTNQQPADVEIGQPNMTTGIPDDAFTTIDISGGTTTTTGVTTQEQAAMCSTSDGVDANNNPIYPALCEYTLSFPGYAISDGTNLYIADSGNDRVLIYTPIPTADAAPANIVLGQTDFVTDAPDADADTMDAPLSLAWDAVNKNLYVADTYNQRILVYTQSEQDLPYNGVLNAASLIIYAVDQVTIGGTIKAGDKVTITIGNSANTTTLPYTYTIESGDDFAAIVDGLVAAINAGKGDPNVIATADTSANEVVLTSRVPGVNGNNVTVVTSISTDAEITAIAAEANLTGGGSAASVAPGTLVSFLAAPGTTLSDQTAAAPANAKQLPLTLGGVSVYFNGVQSPLMYVSPTQINAQIPFNFGFTGSGTANAWVRIQRSNGTIVATNTVAVAVVPANPGIFTMGGSAPQPANAFHSSSSATGVVSVDGTIKGGDVATICIGSSTALTAATATIPTGCTGGRMYNYVVQPSDGLATIQLAFVAMLADDPQVSATASSEFTRIILQARVPGSAGNGIPFQAAYSTGAHVLMTAIGPAPPSPGVGAMLCCANTAGAPLTLQNPAVAGETVVIYATGLGVPTLAPQIGQDLLSGQPYEGPTNNFPQSFVSSEVNGATANVLRAELAPGMIGIYRVYLQLSATQTTDRSAQMYIAQNDFLSNIVTIPVYSTAQLSSMACTPATIDSGGTTTCTVVLTVAVPTSPTTITLSSSSSLFTVPATVVIPAASTSVSFTGTAGTVGAEQDVTITATLGSASTTATVTLDQ
jgi:uncharacterized protein (TIGR03437 family)